MMSLPVVVSIRLPKSGHTCQSDYLIVNMERVTKSNVTPRHSKPSGQLDAFFLIVCRVFEILDGSIESLTRLIHSTISIVGDVSAIVG